MAVVIRLSGYLALCVLLFLGIWFGGQRLVAPSHPVSGLSAISDLGIWRYPQVILVILPLMASIGTGIVLLLKSR